MVRGALWLVAEIGVGNIFTKQQLREAFPEISQADRRIRDLRKFGWVIHESAQDASLNSDEQRLVTVGVPVWDRSARKGVLAKGPTDKQRREALAAHDYQCAACGIAAGEAYADKPHMRATLSAVSREIRSADGITSQMLACECRRCRAGSSNEPLDLQRLNAEVDNLTEEERAVLLEWIRRGKREVERVERIWAALIRLPKEARDNIESRLFEGSRS